MDDFHTAFAQYKKPELTLTVEYRLYQRYIHRLRDDFANYFPLHFCSISSGGWRCRPWIHLGPSRSFQHVASRVRRADKQQRQWSQLWRRQCKILIYYFKNKYLQNLISFIWNAEYVRPRQCRPLW